VYETGGNGASDDAGEALEALGYVPFAPAGDAAAGEFHCADCGYGIVVSRRLPRCPMCGGGVWEAVPARAPLA
jgi:hypothetical protein